ncbi:hypothetical protein KDA_40450 [Dictyobacter alpinus]|uniref:Secreted protein n=1 Tax=Dictyobacter alpinus TaxID=2014873 RepID=A0A402BAW0_9CHLR|nr:hypothetical protein [Dictyobacter alpinus]GCE28561.1 hypothetical protein KDA_40450 [Dictyobacter alpinus]
MKKTLISMSVTVLCLLLLLAIPESAFAHTSGITPPTHVKQKQARVYSSYDGQWPELSGCWDSTAYVAEKNTVYRYGRAELIILWANDRCGTNWTDIQVLDGTSLYMQAFVQNSTPPNIASDGQFGSPVVSSRTWSRMIYSPVYPARACVLWDPSTSDEIWQCGTGQPGFK